VRERIGSYRIERVLAEGGMGLVYKGRHESLARDAVIKTLLPKDAGDAALRTRLRREAQAQASLKHDHIVTVYDLIEDHDELFIAMGYVDGETLATFVDRQPGSRLKLDDALPLFTQALNALAYVHEEKIVHRDVKPSNFLISGGHLKLADFGIALPAESPRITASLQLLGSPPYMSPEQLEGKSVDQRSDIYSAALVLYRMLAGRPPFGALDYFAHIQARVAGPVGLRTLVPEVPAGVCDAITIALRYDREERFRAAAAFRDALHEGAAGFFISPSQVIGDEVTLRMADIPTEPLPIAPAPEPEPRRVAATVPIVIASVFVAAGAVIFTQPRRPVVPVVTPVQKPVAAPQPVTASVMPPQIVIDLTAPKRERAKEEPAKAVPFSAPPIKTEPVEDLEAKRRRELESLRDSIRRGLTLAEQELGVLRFDAAVEDLDRAAEKAQRDPVEFREERDQIAQLRTRVVEKRVAVEAAKAEAARWASRLAAIEEDLHAERWPEAERFASGIAKDASAPEAIVARARTLLERAKEGRKNGFKDMQVGPTNNTIRKPSSPPGNDV
jgi:tRNA A-37 threonylcarbamoyl transferase component Bud32